jgi:hypothetical protein
MEAARLQALDHGVQRGEEHRLILFLHQYCIFHARIEIAEEMAGPTMDIISIDFRGERPSSHNPWKCELILLGLPSECKCNFPKL